MPHLFESVWPLLSLSLSLCESGSHLSDVTLKALKTLKARKAPKKPQKSPKPQSPKPSILLSLFGSNLQSPKLMVSPACPWGLEFGFKGLGFWVLGFGLGFRVLGFWVLGFGLGFRV